MKKLRLLITKNCNKNCSGCCNNQWDLSKLPVCTSYAGYDEIMITGGEPMTEPLRVQRLIRAIRKENTFAKIILYTTDLATVLFYCLDWMLDGLTVTIHDRYDARHFVESEREANFDESLSLRLNIFKGISIFPLKHKWKIKEDIEWIENCPLPENEVFMRTADAL